MPLFRRLPKRGFNPLKKNKIGKINLNKIQLFIDNNKINTDSNIDIGLLKKEKLINKKYSKYKILGNGEINKKINIEADFISASAKQKLEKLGGLVTLKNKT